MKKTNPIKKLYDSKLLWMILSLLTAVALWVSVVSDDAEVYKQTFRGVQVELVGEDILRSAKNMVITDLDTSTVTIEVVGPRRVVSALRGNDLVAQVDVSKLNLSAYTTQGYNIVFPDGTDTSDLQVTVRTPETVNFMVSLETKKTVQVKGSFDGSVADGYTAELPVFEPSVITVFGPETYLKDISYAWVTFGENDISSTFSARTGFSLMNSSGEECSTTGLTFSDEAVRATLTILEVKEIPLHVDIIEGAGANSANTKVTIAPESISLAGDSAILSELNMITLATIDLTDFSATYSDTYPIKFNNELKNLTGISEAKVTVEVVGLETRTFPVKNFICKNVTEGFAVDILSESLSVVLRGTPEDLEQVRSENIRAVADLADFNISTGQFMPTVKISVDGFTEVGAIGEEYKISIEIRKE